jgi:hypothetical protein
MAFYGRALRFLNFTTLFSNQKLCKIYHLNPNIFLYPALAMPGIGSISVLYSSHEGLKRPDFEAHQSRSRGANIGNSGALPPLYRHVFLASG